MTFIEFEIQEYHVNLRSQIIGNDMRRVATIECAGTDDYRCLIYFLEEGESIPDINYNESTKSILFYRPERHYPWFIDILRNEKPVRCRIFPDQLDASGIRTGFEPVGEGE